MRLLVTGSRGQLGLALQRAAAEAGHEFAGYDLPELDITDPTAVRAVVARVRPDAIVNCAAYTAVDAAEADEGRALAVNGAAVAGLAAAADEAGALLVQISTDFVFDGASPRPYREDDPPHPLSAYGRSKLAGERAAERAHRHLIVRTAWLFGEGANFVEAIHRQLDAGATELRVVGDQRGCPTYATDLAGGLLRLLDAGAAGVVHAVNQGQASWFEFAVEIVRQLDAAAEVVPTTTAQAARLAPRPAYSVLDTSRFRGLVGTDLPPWQDALARRLAAGTRAEEVDRRSID